MSIQLWDCHISRNKVINYKKHQLTLKYIQVYLLELIYNRKALLFKYSYKKFPEKNIRKQRMAVFEVIVYFKLAYYDALKLVHKLGLPNNTL